MDEIVAMSRERIERGSKSFAAAARLFPPDIRDDAYMLYAWCRHCDDVIDGQDLGHRQGLVVRQSIDARAALASLEAQTNAALAGRPDDPVFVALARVMTRHRIPTRHPLDLLEGFRMDVDERSYRTIGDTLAYCYHVAGVVGVMMAHVMGVRDRATLERAQDLGIAFQLTNICRDIIDDAANGRVYLPLDWLDDAGVPADGIVDIDRRGAVAGVAQRLLETADRYYESAACGLPALPLRAAWAVAAAGTVYRDIGTIVRRRGADAWTTRAVVSRPAKLLAITGGLATALASRTPRWTRSEPRRDPALWTKADLADE